MENIDLSTEPLLEKINHLLQTLHCVTIDLDIKPKKEHHINFINYVDLQEMRPEFIKALFSTVTRYVYTEATSQNKVKLYSQEKNMEVSDAFSYIQDEALKTFNKKNIQGQFSELLLFNLLQHHFRAVPLVRKMPLTTNPSMERNGADAIHINSTENNTILYLGEAKTYTCGFKKAFNKSINSVMKTYKEYRSELNLYSYNEFINPKLKEIAEKFLAGQFDGEIHIVVLISFDRPKISNATSKEEILNQIIEDVKSECKKITENDFKNLDGFPEIRLNYIFLPFQELELLFKEFQVKFQ